MLKSYIRSDQTAFVQNASDLERIDFAGANLRRMGFAVQLIPRISKRDFALAKLGQLPEATGYLEMLLRAAHAVPEHVRDKIYENKKAVVMPDGEIIFVQREKPYKEDKDLPEEPSQAATIAMAAIQMRKEEAEGVVEDSKKKKYNLVQVLEDATLAAKFCLSPRLLETAKRISGRAPKRSAEMLQQAMNAHRPDMDVVVNIGRAPMGKALMKVNVKAACATSRPADLAADALVIGDHIFVYGPDGRDGWHVCGPLQYTYECYDIYKLICEQGCLQANLLLSLELVVLGIDIFDGKTYQAPSMKFHVGTADVSPQLTSVSFSELTASRLTSEQRLAIQSYTDRLLQVRDVEGNPIATAIRVSGRHVLVNAHVLDSYDDLSVDGVPLTVRAEVGRDIDCVVLPGVAEPWGMRDPVVGEMAAVCYRSEGGVSCTQPVKIVAVDAVGITTTMVEDAIPGTSGGALVALSDMSLLGIHSGETNHNLIATRFGSSQFSIMLDNDQVSSVGVTVEQDFGAKLFADLRKKGVDSVVVKAMRSLVPLFMGDVHVGMAVNASGKIYTTCDVEMSLRVGNQRQALIFNSTDYPAQYVAEGNLPGLETPAYRRKPVYFEKVFVVGYDSEDAYFSRETHVAHIGLNAKTFVIADIEGVDRPLTGGLVLGMDGAVIGQCGVRSDSSERGAGYVCYPVYGKEIVNGVAPIDMLTRHFPFLNVRSWDSAYLDEVFVHTSVGSYNSGQKFNAGPKPLANIGDNAAKAALYSVFRDEVLSHSVWQPEMQKYQSNRSLARLAWKFGLTDCLIAGAGVVLKEDAKAYADMVEALIGAVYLNEKTEVFMKFCETLGVIPARRIVKRSSTLVRTMSGLVEFSDEE